MLSAIHVRCLPRDHPENRISQVPPFFSHAVSCAAYHHHQASNPDRPHSTRSRSRSPSSIDADTHQPAYLTESVYRFVVQNQFPHKSVSVSFIITNIKKKMTDLCGNWLLQNKFMNTFCEITASKRLCQCSNLCGSPPESQGRFASV